VCPLITACNPAELVDTSCGLDLRFGAFRLVVVRDVGLCSFARVVGCVLMMAVSQMCMMGRGLNVSSFVVLSGFPVVFCRVVVMFCCLRVVLCCLLRHTSPRDRPFTTVEPMDCHSTGNPFKSGLIPTCDMFCGRRTVKIPLDFRPSRSRVPFPFTGGDFISKAAIRVGVFCAGGRTMSVRPAHGSNFILAGRRKSEGVEVCYRTSGIFFRP